MIEVRLHGRGGQGVVTAAELLAVATFEDGKVAQAFPSFGSERMGAPVESFVKISDNTIRSRSQITNPDYIIVQDPTLIGVVDVLRGLKDNGLAIINTQKKPNELTLQTKAKVITVPATKIATEVIGRPIPNTTLMGAFAAATGIIKLESIERCIKERFPGELGEKNAKAAQAAYDYVRDQQNERKK
nr:pyruvate ferredoxin oxidoreductase subunit gamma [Candidatus Njordarchaeota archaeon]